MRMLLPPAASGRETDFHRYHAAAWSHGADRPPRSLAMDGCAALDRNGLRPSPYVTGDHGVTAAGSEGWDTLFFANWLQMVQQMVRIAPKTAPGV